MSDKDRFEALGFRWYRKNAKAFPSATSITGCILGWSDKAFYIEHSKNDIDRIFQIAGDRGTEVHEYIDKLVNKQTTIALIPAKYQKPLELLMEKVDSVKPEIIATEMRLVHDWGFAGTADVVCKVGDKIEIWDWKTGIYKRQHEAQLGAYALAYENMTGKKVEGMRIFSIDLKGIAVKMFTIRQVEYCKRRFLNYFESWKHIHWKYLKEGIRDRGKTYKWPEELIFMDTVEEYLKKGDKK